MDFASKFLTKIALAALLLILGVFVGWAQTSAHYKAKEFNAYSDSQVALSAATASVAIKELELQQAVLTKSDQLLTEQKNADNQITTLRTAVRTGAVRLSILANRDPAATCQDSRTAVELGDQARSELMPQTAEDLISIAADGDAAVRQLNAVIDAYAAIRSGCGTDSASKINQREE